MTAEVLAQLGYAAATFTDGRAALEAFEKTPGAFQVVVTDEVMPALTGTELARRVRRLRPDLPVVLVSGYSGPILTQQALDAGVSELLQETRPVARARSGARAGAGKAGERHRNHSCGGRDGGAMNSGPHRVRDPLAQYTVDFGLDVGFERPPAYLGDRCKLVGTDTSRNAWDPSRRVVHPTH